MKKKNTIFALVRLDNNNDQFSCNIYGKQTSNFEKIQTVRCLLPQEKMQKNTKMNI